MATVKMGAIVTEISGSIGGTTFRRNAKSVTVQNKQRGQSKNILLLNPALPKLADLHNRWLSMGQIIRGYWNTAAPSFLFPDKFGSLRALSGRMLFIKLAGNMLCTNEFDNDPQNLEKLIPTVVFENVNFIDINNINCYFDTNQANTFLIFQIELIKGLQISPTFTRRKIILATKQFFFPYVNIAAAIKTHYSFLNPGQLIRVYVTVQNEWGFRSIPQTKIFTMQ